MEHIIQFGITIDDNAIKNNIERAAAEKIASEFTKDIKKVVFKTNAYSGRIIDDPTEWTKWHLKEFLEEHRDEIIDRTATMLMDKLSRSKAVKAMVDEVVNAAKKENENG